MPLGLLGQRGGHHDDVGVAQQVVEPRGVARPGQAVRGGVDTTRTGHRGADTSDAAQQLPRQLADVTESEEADADSPP